ncbi:MAG: Ig-like domain-containing protein, partial [Planctomycetota bacterium]|nr:Ig-like domain-containing protein [Planctomycetota bacterium]
SSDPEGQPLTHQWVQIAGPPVQLDDNTAPDPKFEAPNLLVNGDVVFELRVSDGVHTSMDLVTVTIVSDNDAPVNVSAGTDQVVDELDVVRLVGTGIDLEGQDLTYRWVQTGGTAVVLSDAGSSSPVFQAPEGLVNSDLTFELRVSDGVHVTTDTVTITVHADDDAPNALAGENQSVDENEVVHLAGQGVDPEGQGLTYEWVQVGGPSVLLADPDAAQTQFTAPDLLANTDIVLQLRISDGGHTSTDTVTVTVRADDDAPVADAGADLSVPEESLVQLQGHGVDPEGQGLHYTWVQTSGPALVLNDAHAQNPTFTTPNLLANSDVEFELHVSDGLQTSVDTVVVTIQADDDAPTADAGRNQVVEELDRVQLIGGGVDPEGQGLTYEWVQTSGTPVVLDDAQAENPSFQAPDGLVNSDLRFELRVSDGVKTSVDSVTVTVHADNDAPSANAGHDQRVEELDRVTLNGAGVDPEAQGLIFEWVQVSGPTVVLDDPGLAAPSFQAPELVEGSQVVFELRVGDGVHVSTDTVTIQIDGDDDAPVEVSAGPDRTVDELDLIQLTGSGHELEGQDLTYEWVQTSGVLVELSDPTGPSPAFEAPEGLVNSELEFRLSVSDGTHVVTDDVTITVRADNDVPTADAGESFDVEEGSFAYLSGVGLDPEGQGVTYEWVQVSGPQVSLDNPHAAEASFLTPNQVKNTDIVFELHVSDGVNTSVDEVTVTIEADDDAPTADAGTGGTFDAGDNVRLMGSGTDPEGVGLTYSWVQKEGPPVSLFNAGSQTPSFTAPTGIGGTLVFEVSVSDGVNTSVDTVRIVINESAEELDPEVGEADPVQTGFSAEAAEDPFHQLNEALDHVEADVADGPLQEVVGQVITLADAPLGAESEQALLDLLAPLAGIEDFSKVFQTPTGIDESQDGEETISHDSVAEDVLQRDVSEDLARDGIEKPEASNDNQAEGGIAKFFGLVRGLAGTTDKAENQNHDRKSKDAKRRD